eukprot:CAMPEP_0113898984 /NCGR_PEP_ID=MMETSP0780_2-20120614/19734_1 /TAXON_ID=652834 /ORGANISM="Palpitomonas bilix" /LENGTH=578 /DNA_ID=CAMNT_0000891011 /DNA_START=106 /DNA_END=1842 /DNA_ORIENTATION=- /assembly_acc=CAM_ASM_000599
MSHKSHKFALFSIKLAKATPKGLFLVLGVFQIVSIAGVVFGWPSLESLYLRRGVFNQTCNASTVAVECKDQDLKLGQIFLAGSWSVQGGRLINGIVYDRLGHHVGATVAGGTCLMGALMLAFSSNELPLFIPGMFLLGWGGPLFQLIAQNGAALVPKYRTTIITIYSGLFNSSSYVFLIMNAVNLSFGVSDSVLFLVFSGFIFLLFVMTFLFIPPVGNNFFRLQQKLGVAVAPFGSPKLGGRRLQGTIPSQRVQPRPDSEEGSLRNSPVPTVGSPRSLELQDIESPSASEQGANKTVSASRSFAGPASGQDRVSTKEDKDNEDPRENIPSYKKQTFSLDFITVLIFFMVHNLTVQFEVVSVGGRMRALVEHEQNLNGTFVPLSADNLILAFNACLGSVVVLNPLLGLMIQKIGFGAFFYFINVLYALYNILSIFLPSYLQPIPFILYALARTGLYGNFFSYCAGRFGFSHFGTHTGVAGLLTAVFTLLQYPLLSLTLDVFDGNYDVVHYMLGGLSLPLLACCEYMRRRDVQLKDNGGRRRKEEDKQRSKVKEDFVQILPRDEHTGVERAWSSDMRGGT